mmetsp:Transcript_79406/g.97141  ORF Transcript_79406/g.97141 Transcript_79406/m.97141 type:complete len:88 (+) Transcript_79406:150-413(+)
MERATSGNSLGIDSRNRMKACCLSFLPTIPKQCRTREILSQLWFIPMKEDQQSTRRVSKCLAFVIFGPSICKPRKDRKRSKIRSKFA